MPKFTITRQTHETYYIVVEADTEEQAEARDLDGTYDELWENAEWDDYSESDTEEADEEEELTKPLVEKKDLFGRKG